MRCWPVARRAARSAECTAPVTGQRRAPSIEPSTAGMPDHIARMALFLAADDSAMCTGQDFVVDGGWV